MAYPINSGSIIELQYRGMLFGQKVMIVRHWLCTGGATNPDGAALLTTFNSQLNAAAGLYAALAASISQSVTGLRARLQWIHPSRYRAVEFTPTNLTGGIADLCITANMSAAITLLADQATRHGIGTVHMFGVPQSESEEGLITAGQQALYAAVATKLLVTIPTLGNFTAVRPIIYNRVDPDASLVATSAAVKQTTRVMRRRTVGLGE